MKFHERFHIEVGLGEAKRRFVNRAANRIFGAFLLGALRSDYEAIEEAALSALAERARPEGDLLDHHASAHGPRP